MSKLTTAQIKELIVDEVYNRGELPVMCRVPEKEALKPTEVKHWRREIKKSFKDNSEILRVFECWVGWNNYHAVVKTNYPEDTQILSLDIILFDGLKHTKREFYGLN